MVTIHTTYLYNRLDFQNLFTLVDSDIQHARQGPVVQVVPIQSPDLGHKAAPSIHGNLQDFDRWVVADPEHARVRVVLDSSGGS